MAASQNDMEFAFQLQLTEALAASCRDSASSKGEEQEQQDEEHVVAKSMRTSSRLQARGRPSAREEEAEEEGVEILVKSIRLGSRVKAKAREVEAEASDSGNAVRQGVEGSERRKKSRQAQLQPRMAETAVAWPKKSKPGKEERCKICLDVKPTESFAVLQGCQHRFCVDCISQHVEVKVKHSEVPVSCPQSRCSGFLSSEELSSLRCTPVVMETWSELEAVAAIPEALRFYCPFPDCSALMMKPDSGGSNGDDASSSFFSSDRSGFGITSVECFHCHRLFCADCQVPWHGDLSCRQHQQLRSKVENEGESEFFKLAASEKWRQCLKCKRMIELKEGCIHMTCRCGHQFCYNCGRPWSSNCRCKETPMVGVPFHRGTGR